MCTAHSKSIKGILLYPEFPNTFFLTYRIFSDETKNYSGIEWDERPCEWGDTKQKLVEIFAEAPEIICCYGTEKPFSEGTLPDTKGFMQMEISLPTYHPRFLFIPYDYSVYDTIYKNIPRTSINGIITGNDITDFPDWNNKEITEFLRKRGIRSPFFSDTGPQAKKIEKRLKEHLEDHTCNNHPFRVYYYGAPLTIFYLNHYPEFLPIRIPDDDGIKRSSASTDKDEFKTYLYIYYKEESIKNITNLKEEIQKTIFSSYVDAILEPVLLTPMYRLFREKVPRGQFYTMRNVQDFARAITLHCSPDINKIREEMAIKEETARCIIENRIRLLHDFKDRVSESERNEDKIRVENLKKIKEIALGCRIFLLAYLYKEVLNTDYFSDASQSDFSHINKGFPHELSYLYNAVISCLTWEYVLSLVPSNVPDISGAVLSSGSRNERKGDRKCSKNLFLRYKKAESAVISNHSSFKIKENGADYSKDKKDLNKLIAYIESAIKKHVSDALQNKPLNEQKDVYNSFSKLVQNRRYSKGKILYEFLREMVPLKIYKYV